MTVRLGALALLAGALVSAPAVAAQAIGAASGAPRGWIGISYEVRTVGDADGVRSTAVITDVSPGSPAARAGVRVGDQLLSLNGHRSAAELREGGRRIRPAAGDPVELVVVRDGRRHTLTAVAEPRPNAAQWTSTLEISFPADSTAEVMFRAMDSLRARLAAGEPGELVLLGEPPAPGRRVRVATGNRARRVPAPDEGFANGEIGPVRAPFEFFVFRSEAHDSLSRELERLNREIRVTQARHARLVRGPPDGSARAVDEARRAESERAVRRLADEAEELRAAMAEAARVEASERFAVVAPTPPQGRVESRSFGPLTPYVLGRNRALGAEVVDLKPGLAGYFDVSAGVLVVDVPEGTPAEVAGIRPGDVIVAVGAREVRSIGGLREGLAWGSGQPLTLVRRGERLRVELRR